MVLIPKEQHYASFPLLAALCIAAVRLSAGIPPQDQDLPYTRSASANALGRIKGAIAVFAGSRYAYVRGFKVRLDDEHWRDEAVLRDGVIYVPEAFAGVLDLKAVNPDPAPAYLANRWVYSLVLPACSAPTVSIDGRPYVDLAQEARRRGWTVSQDARGLLLVGHSPLAFSPFGVDQLDSVITLFDTPEKFADPGIATRRIPTLARQGPFTDHVKATPEQLRILSGPEARWPSAPRARSISPASTKNSWARRCRLRACTPGCSSARRMCPCSRPGSKPAASARSP